MAGIHVVYEFFEKCNFTEWLSNYTVSHTYSVDAYDLLGPAEQLYQEKKYKLSAYQLSQTKLYVTIVFFLSTVRFLFLWDSKSHIVYLT